VSGPAARYRKDRRPGAPSPDVDRRFLRLGDSCFVLALFVVALSYD
jgi:hypothetical protein